MSPDDSPRVEIRHPKPTRHIWIPDTQIKPGVDTAFLDWVAGAILKYKPDVIVHLGDHWDFPSLSTHNEPGSKEAEGQRVKTDIDAGNEAFERLCAPIRKEMQRLAAGRRRRWFPEMHYLHGNHDHRLTRAMFRDPKWDGVLSMASLDTGTFRKHDFLNIIEIDGIAFSHYFPNPHSGRPIGGTIVNRLNGIGQSFVAGHEQGLLYAIKQYPGFVRHGLVAGSCYLHNEEYRPRDVQNTEWRGIILANEVTNGTYDVCPLSMGYLRREFS